MLQRAFLVISLPAYVKGPRMRSSGCTPERTLRASAAGVCLYAPTGKTSLSSVTARKARSQFGKKNWQAKCQLDV